MQALFRRRAYLSGASIDTDVAVDVVNKACSLYKIETLMTFGGEPLLFPRTVCAIHSAAKRMGVEKRQVITNGFFSKDSAKITEVAQQLAISGVNDILLSVDAFHQETIPVDSVKTFALAVKGTGVRIRTHPAWLVSEDHNNPYNEITRDILSEFEQLGIITASGNVVFPSGSAIKYLAEYLELSEGVTNPYIEDPLDIRTLSVSANGDVLDGNIYRDDVLNIIKSYTP